MSGSNETNYGHHGNEGPDPMLTASVSAER